MSVNIPKYYYEAIQCHASTGQLGSFIFSKCDGTDLNRFIPDSPVFDCLANLYSWLKTNGFKEHRVPGLTTVYTKE